MNENYLTPENSVLDDLDLPPNIPPASKGLRLLNLILDFIVLAVLGWIVSVALAAVGISDTINSNSVSNFQMGLTGFHFSIGQGTIITLAYYILMEGLLNGQTIGKLITNTQAVDKKTFEAVSMPQALVRTLCRLIPFSWIGALFVQPWHDAITGTTVILKP